MDEATFWALIDETRATAGGEPEAHVEALRGMLTAMPVGDVVAFGVVMSRLASELYTWDLWGAAYVILGGCSDDSFVDFRHWVISQGQDAYRCAATAPDSLADILDGVSDESIGDGEGFVYVAAEVCEQQTGQDIYSAPDGAAIVPSVTSAEPAGEPFDEDEESLERRYPQLWALVA